MRQTKSKTSPQAIGKSISERSALVILVATLVLSGFNLVLMISQTGLLNGLASSWQTLQANYGTRMTVKQPEAKKDDAPKVREPEVVWSVVKYRTDEQQKLMVSLAQPLLMHYAGTGTLKVALIERRSPASRDVSVRLFFVDGTETAYLWPSTHSDDDGVWMP